MTDTSGFVVVTKLDGRRVLLARGLVGIVRPFQLGDQQGIGAVMSLINGETLPLRSSFDAVAAALEASEAPPPSATQQGVRGRVLALATAAEPSEGGLALLRPGDADG